MDNYSVYILKCSDNSYYTGVTNDLDRRIYEHTIGESKGSYTYSRRPISLVFHYQFNDINDAIAIEKQIKGWTRKKKEALMQNDWNSLKVLAECLNETSHKNMKKV